MCVRRVVPVEVQDPLRTVQSLLRTIWTQAELHGLFIARWQNGNPPEPVLLTSQDQLDQADPFAPLMHRNAAWDAYQILKAQPSRQYGFMLRPCEIRCLQNLHKKTSVNLNQHIWISSDCLATFPSADFLSRLAQSEDREEMTKSALHFAHQGGIEPSRYRNACQFCDSSSPEEVDLSFELLGIHTAENLVLNFKSSEVARTLGIDRLNGQTVPEEITLNRERILQKLNDWRGQALAYATSHLDDDQKNINGLIEHLNACSTCRQVLQDFCPLWDIEWLRKNTGDVVLSMEAWLKKCSGCGICEEECPEGFPLFSVILFNNKSLRKHYD